MTFKQRRYECDGCGRDHVGLYWDTYQPESCACGGVWHETGLTLSLARNRGVIDDQLEGGPRLFENLGHEPVYVESKSQLRREVDQRNLVNVVRHDSAYYAKQRKQHDERMRDTGSPYA